MQEIVGAREILLAISEVGKETVMCKACPAGLMQTVVVLNGKIYQLCSCLTPLHFSYVTSICLAGVLLNFPDDAMKLKNSIAQLCLLWMNSKLDGHELLGCQTILFFIKKSLKDKGSVRIIYFVIF